MRLTRRRPLGYRATWVDKVSMAGTEQLFAAGELGGSGRFRYQSFMRVGRRPKNIPRPTNAHQTHTCGNCGPEEAIIVEADLAPLGRTLAHLWSNLRTRSSRQRTLFVKATAVAGQGFSDRVFSWIFNCLSGGRQALTAVRASWKFEQTTHAACWLERCSDPVI